MQRSEERSLTTHAGGLPRPPELVRLYVRRAEGEAVDPAARAAAGREALRWVVAQQIAAGIEVGNNGEQPRVGFSAASFFIPGSCSPDPKRILHRLLAAQGALLRQPPSGCADPAKPCRAAAASLYSGRARHAVPWGGETPGEEGHPSRLS
jgi:hypothetical protein